MRGDLLFAEQELRRLAHGREILRLAWTAASSSSASSCVIAGVTARNLQPVRPAGAVAAERAQERAVDAVLVEVDRAQLCYRRRRDQYADTLPSLAFAGGHYMRTALQQRARHHARHGGRRRQTLHAARPRRRGQRGRAAPRHRGGAARRRGPEPAAARGDVADDDEPAPVEQHVAAAELGGEARAGEPALVDLVLRAVVERARLPSRSRRRPRRRSPARPPPARASARNAVALVRQQVPVEVARVQPLELAVAERRAARRRPAPGAPRAPAGPPRRASRGSGRGRRRRRGGAG